MDFTVDKTCGGRVLRDYLRRLASGLGQLRRAGRIGVRVEGSGNGLVEPRTANALGMIVAEIVAECLDATAETVACAIALTIDAEPAMPMTVTVGIMAFLRAWTRRTRPLLLPFA